MIFETLAHMADYADNSKIDFSSDAAQAKTVLEALTNIQIDDETLTVGGVTKVNNQNDWYNQHLVGLQDKTPRSIVESNSSNVVY